MAKLTLKELKHRKKHHEKRAKYYQKKIEALDEDKKRIGFRYSKRK